MLINFFSRLEKHLIREWDDYYEDKQYPTISYRITKNSKEQLEIEEATTNVYIYRCLFTDCSTESEGGVLYFKKTNGKLLIEYSFFEECHSKNRGGVFFVSGESECVINNICSYKCYASEGVGQFILASLADDKKNYVISSSICSIYEVYGNSQPIYLSYGSQKCKSVNISNYNVISTSAIYYSDANAISEITYCSLNSNNANYDTCIWFSGSSSPIKHIIESCNIVNNSQQNYDSTGTIYSWKDIEIKRSNFIDNKSKNLFWLYSSPTVTIDDTYIKHETNSLKDGAGSLDTKGMNREKVEIELEFIDCVRLENRFRITSDVYYYILFLNFIRASLLPSIYI